MARGPVLRAAPGGRAVSQVSAVDLNGLSDQALRANLRAAFGDPAYVESLVEDRFQAIRNPDRIRQDKVDARAEQIEIDREANREAEAREYAQACGTRQIVSYATLAAQPKPDWLPGRLLTQGGVYGLAGPPEAGKSLLCRDWLCEIAAQDRNVLYAMSEGQFDAAERFGAHPQIAAAAPRLGFLTEGGLSLASKADRRWLVDHCGRSQPSLVVFDMVYGFGLPDDDGTKGVAPVLAGAKELAAELGAAVLLTGHPGHNGERRFRGSSMWRGSFDGEFHMAGGQFSCEKHKYTDKKRMGWPYVLQFPYLRTVGQAEAASRAFSQRRAIQEDIAQHPGDSQAGRARRLASQLGVSEDHVRRLLRGYLRSA
jgi:AAA domain